MGLTRSINSIWLVGIRFVNQFDMGGLGIRNLRRFNLALLEKWLWRLWTEKEHLWRRFIEAKYGNEWGGWCSHSMDDPYDVRIWKFIQQGLSNFSWFLHFDVGDGSRVRFWHDVRSDDCPLKVAFLELFSISRHKEASINDVLRLSNGMSH